MFKNSISQQGGKWSKRNFIFLLHQGRKNVSFSSVQECDGKHSHFKGFGPIQKWKVPPFFPLCLVLWPGSCTHATCCFTCSPPAEQQCCPVPKQLLFWDEGRPPRNLNRGAWESGKRKKIWFYHLCSETSWALGRPAPKLLSLSFHCNLCTSIKSWILILCCSFNSYPFNPQPCNTAPHLLFPCKRRKKIPLKAQDCLGELNTVIVSLDQRLQGWKSPGASIAVTSVGLAWGNLCLCLCCAVTQAGSQSEITSKGGLEQSTVLYWRRLCMGIHFLLSVLLKGDDLLQKDHSKHLGRSNIASELFTKQSWMKALKPVTTAHSFIFHFCWLKNISYFLVLYEVIFSSDFYSTLIISFF